MKNKNILHYLLSSQIHFTGKAIYTWLALLVTLSAFPAQALAIDCFELDGAYVYSQESTPVYLGFFGGEVDSDSIMNTVSNYGSTVSALSVRNDVGKYGSSVGTYSANDNVASKPPRIYKNGVLITYLTTNLVFLDRVSLSEIDASCTFIAHSPAIPTTYTLTVTKTGTGAGTVGGGGTYASGTTQQVSATATIGSTFTGWSGDCTGTTSPVSVLMNGNKTCTATFQNNLQIPNLTAIIFLLTKQK